MTFHTTLYQPEGRAVTGIIVPAPVVEALGAGKKPPVVVNVNGYIFRTTVAVMGGHYMVPFSSEHRAASGINGGDAIEVELELDSAPRVVEIPDDFQAALDAAGVDEAFDKLSFTQRKEHVRAIEDARTPQTRARRIDKAIALLLGR
ncbi:YdeI/OmpD-associated family protein [Asticcacaulis sp. AC402]|uniref:YdeI/OmpD-associated family protein n=1 Tax=Asticcacaulis sp. AC402 TaxID=1282361 RepID=UPI0003C3D1B3|nr:YdeI/OmpD-associated family protein [Asticcacaulis sp. AC402]ESQ74136.1 hypothetical protein ABAC402_15920 [Asticcacaulis sp. AC402]